MAVFSKRTVMVLLVLFVLISIALRYPLVEHERYQTDSYYIHMLAETIAYDGSAVWLIHPLSYFGYYPYSYPSGVPFLLAEFSAMSGLSTEASILVINMVMAALFCIAAFALVRIFVRKPEFVMLAVLMTILGSRFVDTSYWDGGARAPMIVLLVLVVFTVFRAGSLQDWRYLFAGAALALGCFAIHHMAVMLLLFGMAYILASFQTEFLLRRFGVKKSRAAATFCVIILLSITILSFGFVDYFSTLTLRNLRTSSIFDIDPPILSVLLNTVTSYTIQVGFIIPLSVFAIPVLYMRGRFNEEDQYPVWLLVVFVPLLGNSLYVSMVISPFMAVLAVVWLSHMMSFPRRRKRLMILVAVLIASSLILPVWSTQRWNSETVMSGDTVEVDSQIFNDAGYLLSLDRGQLAICNVNTISLRLGALSGVGFLSGGIQLVINGDVSREAVRENVTWSSAPFPTNLYRWFDIGQEPQVELYVRGLFVHGLGYIQGRSSNLLAAEYFSTHSKIVVVVDNNWASEYVSVYGISDAEFPSELRLSSAGQDSLDDGQSTGFASYVFYESERITSYLVQLPL